MQCRAPSSSTTCAGTPTGQQLTWNVEGQLANWQNTTTNPTVTAKYLYDGEGNRVVQQVTDSTAGSPTTTTTTSYVGSLETYSITTSSGPTNITTTDYVSASKVLAESVNGTLSYLATSYQGSVVAALDSTGNVGVTASQLYAPYGGVRYSNGALPTDYGYTGQRADASTGLDYYGARYYDPTLGQFTSADTLLAGGLNHYGYVDGNPTTATDPSGHMADSQVLTLMGGGENTGMIAFGLAAIVALGSGAAIAALTRQSSASGADTAAALSAAIAANTYVVAGGSVYVTSTGALVVTTGATTTGYAVGSADWLSWSQQVSAAWTADTAGAWNTGRVRNWVTTHTTDLTPVSVVASQVGDGTGGGGGGGAGAGAGHPPAGGGSIADGGGAEPPGDDDPCTCSPPSGDNTGSPANPLENAQYSERVQTAMNNRALGNTRDYFHSFPDIVDNYGANGDVSEGPGGDGMPVTKVRIPGGYLSPGTPGEPGTGTWYDGYFEYVIESGGIVSHRFFNPC